MANFLTAVLATLLWATIILAGPILYFLLRSHNPAARALAQAGALVMLDIACVYSPTLYGAQGMTWAWLAKLSELLVFLSLFFTLNERHLLSWPSARTWWRTTLFFVLLTSLVSWWCSPPTTNGPPSWGLLLYQASMPGLAEELVYRGVLLCLLDQALGRRWNVFGVQWGWGSLLTTAFFFAAHAVSLDNSWTVSVAWELLPDFLLFGMAACWLRYRYRSLWPCIILHNLSNSLLLWC